MIDIDLHQYKSALKTISRTGCTYIFDPIRTKYIKLLPEEMVRQLLLHYLINDRGFSKKLIGVEKGLYINGQIKRFDIVVYDNNAHPKILIECKRSKEKIGQNVFNQISTYNLALHADFMIVTNGVETYSCKMDYVNNSYNFIDHIPNKIEIDALTN